MFLITVDCSPTSYRSLSLLAAGMTHDVNRGVQNPGFWIHYNHMRVAHIAQGLRQT